MRKFNAQVNFNGVKYMIEVYDRKEGEKFNLVIVNDIPHRLFKEKEKWSSRDLQPGLCRIIGRDIETYLLGA